MVAEFALTVLYTQIVVCHASCAAPGLAWTDDHVDQGFAWAPDAVAFGIPDHDGECLLRVSLAPEVTVDPAALWAIRVPFAVTETPIRIGTVINDRDVAIPTGRYSLVFEALPGDVATTGPYAFVVQLTFCTDEKPIFAILKQGLELKTDKVLRTDADRA